MSKSTNLSTEHSRSDVICPVCGRKKSPVLPFIGNLCKDCFLEKYGVAHVPDYIHITICSSCGAYKIGKQWVYSSPTTLEEAVYEAVYTVLMSKIKPVTGLSYVSIKNLESQSPINTYGEYYFKVTAEGKSLEGVVLEKDYMVKVRVSAALCPRCIRRKIGYHEALVQVRGIGGKLEDFEKNLVLDYLDTFPLKLKEQIVDILDKKEGLDLLVTDATSARIIASKMSGRFLGKRIETYSLSGRRNDGRRLGHLTISLRIASVRNGDIICIDGSPNYVLDITGNRIRLIDLESGRESSLNSDQFWSHKIESYTPSSKIKKVMLLSRDPHTIVFLDIESGYTSAIEYPPERVVNLADKELREGDEYIAYLTGKVLYIIS
ncbi:MAG: hypothetical protein F7B59_04980 [Desulfurococcales archaeon]|nr:hypothetical protein [Desulfurococcales archaeon]